MSKTFKIVLVLLVVASIASASLAVFAFIGKEREYTKRVLLEDKLAATLKDKRRLEKEIDSNKKAKEEAETKMTELQEKIDGFSEKIENEKDKAKAATKDLTAKKKEVDELKDELEKERKEKLSISKKLEGLEFDYEKAKASLTRLKSEKKKLQDKISDLKESSVDLDKIVVSSSSASAPSAAVEQTKKLLRGTVLVVNKEYSFVVTDLGQDNGIENGMKFEVRDGTELLGVAEINKVYDTMSSATVLPGGNINRMKKGNFIIESL
ncbi:MAG: hypothetical protein P9L93_07965 [Candidatus Gorgyraea atricola]|nr:hypothetical protein [Candidatus Gorgyraea atricola]